MRAEVIAIGDELTGGALLDTNTQWLSQQLEQTGIRVGFHTTVGDDLDAMVAAISVAIQRATVIVLSGGLGPTADDLTRIALARAVDRQLVRNTDALQHIRDLFARRGRSMPERNELQADFPAGSRVIANPHGTAPGIHLEVAADNAMATHLFALPGVPAELKEMWSESVAPRLITLLGDRRLVVRQRVIRCFGIGESALEQRLPDLVRRGHRPSVGITASGGVISLRVTAEGQNAVECLTLLEPTVATIYQCLGTLVFGEQDDTLQTVVGRLLQQKRLQLATAEIGTCGLLASWLSGDSQCDAYRGGVVIRSAAALQSALGVDFLTTNDADTRSQQVAEMAQSVRDRYQADLGLAVGPSPPRAPANSNGEEIHFALAGPDGVSSHAAIYSAHPAIQRQLAAKRALNTVRLWLLEQGG